MTPEHQRSDTPEMEAIWQLVEVYACNLYGYEKGQSKESRISNTSGTRRFANSGTVSAAPVILASAPRSTRSSPASPSWRVYLNDGFHSASSTPQHHRTMAHVDLRAVATRVVWMQLSHRL